MSGASNRERVFADIVTVDAWHTQFSEGSGTARVHADVVFGTGRLGGETGSSIRFKLRLRRAEVVVITPPTEPLRVLKSTVSRDQPVSTGVIKNMISLASAGEIYSAGDATASLHGASLKLKAGAAYTKKGAHTTQMETQRDFSGINSVQSQDSAGYYRWTLTPGLGNPSLDGRAWSAKHEPRLSIKDLRKTKTHLAPCVRIEVRCRREDVDIFDIEPKDESLGDRLIRSAGFNNRRAAAESYIRSILMREGLHFNNFDDPFGLVTLADVVAREQDEEEGEGENGALD